MALQLGFAQAVLLTTTTNPVLTALGTSSYLFLKAIVVNTSASNQTVTAYIVPTGGSVGASTEIVNAQAIAAGQSAALGISGEALTNSAAFYIKCSGTNKATLSATYVII